MFIKGQYSDDLVRGYELVIDQLKALIEGESDLIANLANASALLNQFLTDINWVGFYLMKKGELLLGPFQGLPACIHIPVGKGVCGTAVAKKETQCVKDVHEFPDHIACDSASNSEVVIPMITNAGEVVGVLDIDSPKFGRFNEMDVHYLELFVNVLMKNHF